jgi:hypothetical protein
MDLWRKDQKQQNGKRGRRAKQDKIDWREASLAILI